MKKNLMFILIKIIRGIESSLYSSILEDMGLFPDIDIDEEIKWKYLCFAFGFIPLLIIMFPLMLILYWISKLTDKISEKKHKQKPREKNALYFDHMGGAGIIYCKDCNYQKNIISFTHGAYNCDIGRQCQNCGFFFAEYNESEKYHEISPRTEPLLCPKCNSVCDLTNTRDEALFCPRCKSKNLRYSMRYIT
jgi:hypothetical protein